MHRFLMSLGAVIAILAPTTGYTSTEAYKFPQAHVPYVGDKVPTVDGTISPGEYDNCLAITGVVTLGPSGAGMTTVVPKMQQVTWYVGYNDKKLFIAMRSPNPPGIWPVATVKRNDDSTQIVYEDHVEIQIAKDRETATKGGYGFYKIMANPYGAFSDEWYYNGTPGTELAWSIAGNVKCTCTKDSWDLEMEADVRAFEEKSLDGKTWVLQVLRADRPGGVYFAGWIGAFWMSWGQFGQVTFDRTAPVFRFVDSGELAKGDVGLKFEIEGQSKTPVPVTVNVKATDGTGKVIYDSTKKEIASPGVVSKIDFTGSMELTDKGNTAEVLATYPKEDGSGDQVLYNVQMPVIKLTKDYYDTHIAPWLAQRPKGTFNWSFAYWPSYSIARSTLDIDVFGIDERIAKAPACRVSIARKSGGKPIKSQVYPIKERIADVVVKELDLPEGDYVARVDILAADGKTVVGTRSMDFVRRHYAWEGNKIGTSNRVIPPFTPIKSSARQFAVWGRKYEVGNDALLSSIVAEGGEPENILTAPMSFVAAEAGKEFRVAGATCTVGKGTDSRVDLASKGKLGTADYRLDTYLEYDGWYNVKLTLDPGAKPAQFDSLALDIPLWKAADTIYVQRSGDGRRGNKFGAIPECKGLVWQSGELSSIGKEWGSFTPIVFIGNGDKGLWWFAEENRSWTMSDAKSAVEVYRKDDGAIDLKLNIFAAKTTLDKPRTIEFAFLIDPVKQMQDERKWAWGKLDYRHETMGYRHYGGSIDGYENRDEDLLALNKLMTDPNWVFPAPDAHKYAKAYGNYYRGKFFGHTGPNDYNVFYGSTTLTGFGLDAFDSYAGEWFGRTDYQPTPQTEFVGFTNLQGSKKIETPRDLTTVAVNFDKAYEDCYVWHHQRLVSKVPMNGTWWDNESCTTIHDYDPSTGEFYDRFNVFTRRRLTKRLATMCFDEGKQPWWLSNMHVDWSFTQVGWHIENDFYIDHPDACMSDQLSVDQFRAMARIKRGLIHRLAASSPAGTQEQTRRQSRSVVGMCLLHDIGSYFWGTDKLYGPYMLDILDKQVRFFDGAEFIPYWRNDVFQVKTPGVYASVYRGNGKAVVVVLSTIHQETDVEFSMSPDILGGKKISKLSDAETGYEFEDRYNDGKSGLGEFGPKVFGMGDRSVRLLLVE